LRVVVLMYQKERDAYVITIRRRVEFLWAAQRKSDERERENFDDNPRRFFQVRTCGCCCCCRRRPQVCVWWSESEDNREFLAAAAAAERSQFSTKPKNSKECASLLFSSVCWAAGTHSHTGAHTQTHTQTHRNQSQRGKVRKCGGRLRFDDQIKIVQQKQRDSMCVCYLS
jgi:hypothetical protein